MGAIDPRTLGQIILIESLVAQLPNRASMLAFAARGLEEVPGTGAVWFQDGPPPDRPGVQAFELRHGGQLHAVLCFQVSDPAVFATLTPYLKNLAFMLGLVLGERAQREENERYRTQLETLVEARTRALSESEARFRTFVEESPVALLLLRQDGCCVDCNSASVALYGVSGHDQILGRYPGQFAPEYQPDGRSSAEAAKAHLDQVQRSGSAKFEWTCLLPDGRTIVTDIRLAPLVLGGEQLVQCAAVDISERKRAEAERREAEAQVQRAQKMASLGSLAGGMAHDMNNVLGAILALASIHQHLAAEGSRLWTSMDTIAKACQRGKSLVHGLLGFAREDLAEVRPLDLNALLRDQVSLLEHTTLQKVTLRTELSPDLLPLQGDPAALSHAVMNLCVNAVDAMAQGGILTLRTRNQDAATVLLEVADTGHGMAPEVMDQALDPFFTTKPPGQGTGLGLPIVYRTVQAHHGRMEIRSGPGLGTTVSIRLPAGAGGAAPAPAGAAAPGSQRPLRILVVDDDPLLQASLPPLLETAGHRAALAGGGEEAIRILARDGPFDVILLDLNMPGLDGAGTLPRLRALKPGIPVLLITGKTDQLAMDLARAQPRTSLLAKPFGLAELQARLGELLLPEA